MPESRARSRPLHRRRRTSVREIEDEKDATALAPVLRRAVASAPALSRVTFGHNGKRYHAVALPTDSTQALGAARLQETDLGVPVQGDARISLTRSFHS